MALVNMTGSELHDYQLQMVGAFIAGVYVLLGRYFIRGRLAGSLEG